MTDHKRILITGAAGVVATGMRPVLAAAFPEIVLFDRLPVKDPAANETVVVGDMGDRAAIEKAMAGVTGVVHLAVKHGPGVGFEEALDANYRGFIYLLDAFVAVGGKSFIFASSNHGWGYHATSKRVGTDAPPRPDGWYGLNKVWGEALLTHYADANSFSAWSFRIGNAHAKVGDERRTHMWISHTDLAEIAKRALDSGRIGHKAIFTTADCPSPYFDNSGIAELGYATRDNPMDNLADPAIASEKPPAGIGGEAVGGSFVADTFKGSIDAWRKSNS